jgi:nucleoside-diphosphate-sugar epimerase
MDAFVTGGAGFLGRHLVPLLGARGYRVRGLVVSPADAARVREQGAEPVLGHLENEDALREGLEGCQVVFHCAGRVDLGASFADLYPVNVEGTRRVVTLARAAGVARFVHASAAAVLADGRPIVDADESRPVPPRPLGGYPRTKALAEQFVLQANSGRFSTVAVRLPLLWGAGDEKFLPVLARLARRGLFCWIDHGDYLYSRCHVRNACEGMVQAAALGRGGETYFLTDGPPGRCRDFLGEVLRTQRVEPGRRSIPYALAWMAAVGTRALWSGLRLPGTPPWTRTHLCLLGQTLTVRDAKARHELGYTADVSFEQGLAELAATSQVRTLTQPPPQEGHPQVEEDEDGR